MDRLQTIKFLLIPLSLLLLSGCPEKKEEASAVSRVAAIKASKPEPSPQEWCDLYFTDETAPKLELPPVEPARVGSKIGALVQNKWIWLNLWATWCVPCKREMPLVVQWKEQLVREGISIDLWFLSIDESQDELSQFLRINPAVAVGNSVRLSQPEALEPWLAKYKLDTSSAVPVNILAAPGGKIHCIRTGSLNEGDYHIVKTLVSSESK